MNASRVGAKYADEEAAIEVHGSAFKKPIEMGTLPFSIFLNTEKT